MSHLEDRLAEFVFEDLPQAEMERASRHVAQCLECQQKVQSFQKTLGLLEQVPSREVPRRVVFLEPPSSGRRPAWVWTRLVWALPGSLAALLLLAVLPSGGLSVDWSDGFRVAFGPPRVPEGPGSDLDYEQLDYGRIATALEASLSTDQLGALEEIRAELSRVGLELDRLDDSNSVEIQRVRAEIQRLYDQNQLVQRDFYNQNAAIQLMASRLE